MLALALENDSGDFFMWAFLFLCWRSQTSLCIFTLTLPAIQVYQSMLLQQDNKGSHPDLTRRGRDCILVARHFHDFVSTAQ
jgi:hypothetical protein